MASPRAPQTGIDPPARHRLILEGVEIPPPEVDAGAEMHATVRVCCVSDCSLSNPTIDIVTSDGSIVPTTLVGAGDESGEVELIMKAPRRADTFVWRAVARRDETDAVIHEESDPLTLTFRTVPHETTMAVWDVPSPIVAQSAVKVSVGLRCAAACGLAGQVVEVVDEQGSTIGRGTLGDAPLPGTDALDRYGRRVHGA